jgi:hypothetical protein
MPLRSTSTARQSTSRAGNASRRTRGWLSGRWCRTSRRWSSPRDGPLETNRTAGVRARFGARRLCCALGTVWASGRWRRRAMLV